MGSQAMGYMMVFRGSGIVGPPIGGVIFDATKSYNIPFFMAGSVYAIAALLIVVAALIERKNKMMEEPKKNLHGAVDEAEQFTVVDGVIEIQGSKSHSKPLNP